MATIGGLGRRARTAVDVLMHGSHGLTQPLETQVVALDAHVGDLQAENRLLRDVHARLDGIADEIAGLVGPSGKLIATGSPWWTLLPFTTHRVRLGEHSFTADHGVEPERDLRTRLLEDCAGGQLAGARILDLGCLEGGFAIECARRGASEVVGIEARPLSVRRCELLKDLLGLDNATFVCGDILHELARLQEPFDVILATGILYHLSQPDVALRLIRERCRGATVICTHVADPDHPTHGCSPDVVDYVGRSGTYSGRRYSETDATNWTSVQSVGEGDHDLWASWNDESSFWPFEADLRRMILDAGFSTVDKVVPGEHPEPWQVDQVNRVLLLASV